MNGEFGSRIVSDCALGGIYVALFVTAQRQVEVSTVGKATSKACAKASTRISNHPSISDFGGLAGERNKRTQAHFASGGSDIRMASMLPPVIRPNLVPRSCSRLNST